MTWKKNSSSLLSSIFYSGNYLEPTEPPGYKPEQANCGAHRGERCLDVLRHLVKAFTGIRTTPSKKKMLTPLLRFWAKSVARSPNIESIYMQIGIKSRRIKSRFAFLATDIGMKQYQYTQLFLEAKCSISIASFVFDQTAADYCITKPNFAQLLIKS